MMVRPVILVAMTSILLSSCGERVRLSKESPDVALITFDGSFVSQGYEEVADGSLVLWAFGDETGMRARLRQWRCEECRSGVEMFISLPNTQQPECRIPSDCSALLVYMSAMTWPVVYEGVGGFVVVSVEDDVVTLKEGELSFKTDPGAVTTLRLDVPALRLEKRPDVVSRPRRWRAMAE